MISRIVVTLEFANHAWTVDLDLNGIESIAIPGWLRGLAVVSCVTPGSDVGLSNQLWTRLLEGPAAALFKLECERAALAGILGLGAIPEHEAEA